MQPIEYCVSIRTLGTAGEKYQKELNSLLVQTWKPKKILVYIAENYPLPKETIGIEEYIVCKKGIVMQRSLDWKEIDTEYALFLDDDMELAPDAVERMFKGLIENGGDCIATDVFGNYKSSPLRKIAMFMRCLILTKTGILRCAEVVAIRIITIPTGISYLPKALLSLAS